MLKSPLLHGLALMLTLPLALVGCTGPLDFNREATATDTPPMFRLSIYPLPAPGASPTAQPEPLLVLTESDIESYQWQNQVLTLSPTATLALTTALANEFMTVFSSTLGQTAPLVVLSDHRFSVSLDEELVYSGLLLDLGSARLYRAPTAYAQQTPVGNLQLTLRPYHPFWGQVADTPEWAKIRDVRIQEIFTRAGKLIK